MEYREFRAKTVNDAITEALIELEITSDMIEYEVIEEGSTGLLGLFSKDAVIRARRKEDAGEEEDIFDIRAQIRSGSLLDDDRRSNGQSKAEKKAEKKDAGDSDADKAAKQALKASRKGEGKNAGDGQSKNAADGRGRNAADGQSKNAVDGRGRNAADGQSKNAVDGRGRNAGDGNGKNAGDDYSRNGGDDQSRSAGDGGRQAKTPNKPADIAAMRNAEPKPENKVSKAPAVVKDVDEEVLRRVLNAIFDKLDIQGGIDIAVNKEERTVNINVDGEDTGDLIGKRGQTLDAVQYLLSIIVNKEQECYFRVKLDTNNYRERRQKTLENLARNMAAKVKKTRKKVALEPMNPYERRVIHSYLQADKLVTTKSEGEEPNRRVVIYYKKS